MLLAKIVSNDYWLVVDLPLWKKIVSWDYASQYLEKEKNVWHHQLD